MKRIIKKNQVIITSLVIMIVVAGYLNFTSDQSTTAVSNDKSDLQSGELADISEEGGVIDVNVTPEEDMTDIETGASSDESAQAPDESKMDVAMESTDGENIDDVDSIGEAVLTSTPAAKSFSTAAKLSREQTRSQNKETLMAVINNSDAAENLKEEAMDSLMALTNVAERELAAETLLEAKGFNNSVVSINEDSVDVVICLESLSDTQKAQIEDIVKRKAEVEADKIVITTLK